MAIKLESKKYCYKDIIVSSFHYSIKQAYDIEKSILYDSSNSKIEIKAGQTKYLNIRAFAENDLRVNEKMYEDEELTLIFGNDFFSDSTLTIDNIILVPKKEETLN